MTAYTSDLADTTLSPSLPPGTRSVCFRLMPYTLKSRATIEMPGEGLEPSRPKGHRILSPTRLPVPPPGLCALSHSLSGTYRTSIRGDSRQCASLLCEFSLNLAQFDPVHDDPQHSCVVGLLVGSLESFKARPATCLCHVHVRQVLACTRP